MTGRPAGWLASAYAEAARAPNTRATYGKCWRVWERWCTVEGRAPLPASPETLASYIVHRADVGDRVSTIRVRLAAISCHHAQSGEQAPTRDPDIQRIIAGIARSQAADTPAQVTGLTAECMIAVEKTARLARPIETENVALCWVMRDALLRRSEAAALLWSDVEEIATGGLLLIRRSKTDQTGTGHVAFLSPDAMRSLARIRPAPAEGRIFPHHPRTIGRRIAMQAKRAGLPGRFRGHSARVGMALDLAEKGASLVELQQVGRWKSANMPAHYVRKQQATRSVVARFYGESR